MNDDEKEFAAICNKIREYTDALVEMRARGIVDERFNKLCQEFIEWSAWTQPRLMKLDKGKIKIKGLQRTTGKLQG